MEISKLKEIIGDLTIQVAVLQQEKTILINAYNKLKEEKPTSKKKKK